MLCGNALYCVLQRCTGWCTVWHGGLLRSRVVYCVVGWFTVCMVVYCVLGRCTVCYGGVLCVMVVLLCVMVVLWWCIVCQGGVLYSRALYCVVQSCTVQ